MTYTETLDFTLLREHL